MQPASELRHFPTIIDSLRDETFQPGKFNYTIELPLELNETFAISAVWHSKENVGNTTLVFADLVEIIDVVNK